MNNSESVTAATLTTLTDRAVVRGGDFKGVNIISAELDVLWESAGAGDIDFYDITGTAKIADVAAPTAATTLTLTTVDVTSWFKGLTGNVTVGIQAAGDGTNAVTVYKACLAIAVSLT